MGAGGGASKAESVSNPYAANNAGSESWNSTSGSTNAVQNPDQIWSGQAPYLQNLYRAGQTQMGGSGQQMGQAQGLYDTAQGTLQGMQNPGINPQLQAYQGEVQRNFMNNIMPEIGGQAGMAGQYGGSRQGVAEGLAAGYANQQVTDMAANLYNQDQNRALQAAQFTPQIGAFGQQIPWYALNQQAGLLGAPAILGQGGSSTSTSSGGGGSSSFDIGGGGGGGDSSSSSWNANVSIA